MRDMAKRVRALEGGRPEVMAARPSLVAVASGTLPDDAAAFLAEHGWAEIEGLSVVVVGGSAGVLVPPTSRDELSPEAAAVLAEAEATFPHACVFEFLRERLVSRVDSPEEYHAAQQWVRRLVEPIKGRAAAGRTER